MIVGIAALYFGVGLILVLFGPARKSITRETQRVKEIKPDRRSYNNSVPRYKIILFRLIITAGFVVMWPLFLPGVLKDNQRSIDITSFNTFKSRIKTKKFTCPKCKMKEAVHILYGYPTDETLQSWFKKEVELGGCIVGKEKPIYKCFGCGHQW